MRNFIHSLLADMELERLQLAKCKKELRNLPEGRLKTGKAGKNLYYGDSSGQLKYILPDSKLAEKVSRRHFLEKRMRILMRNLEAQSRLLQCYVSYEDLSVANQLPKVYRERILQQIERKKESLISDDGMVGFGGRPRHKTPSGEGRDSKGEVILSMHFDRYALTYEYGQPLFWDYSISEEANRMKAALKLPDVIVPDFIFTLPDGRKIYWEHLGMVGDRKYAFKWMKKMQFYHYMGITQGVNLIVTADDCNGTIDLEAISELIESKLAPLLSKKGMH
ncbi:MAG: hypothetical protein ACI4WY_06225 [Anaerovoracaceae bacterium]